MLFYTDRVDVELTLKSVQRKLRCDDLILFSHGDSVCTMELRHPDLLYISWPICSDDGVAREGLCISLADIESLEIDNARITVRGVFNCTLNERLTSEQTLIFAGTVSRVVTHSEFEAILEQEEYENTSSLCLH
jgi:hypothetical protein